MHLKIKVKARCPILFYVHRMLSLVYGYEVVGQFLFSLPSLVGNPAAVQGA